MQKSAEPNWDQRAFEQWIGDRAELVTALLPAGEGGLKALVLLALLDRGDEPSTYEGVAESIEHHKVLRAGLQKDSLRSAVTNLGRTLGRTKTHRLEKRKTGQTSQLRLVKIEADIPSLGNRPAPPQGRQEQPGKPVNKTVKRVARRSLLQIDPPLASPKRIAESLVRNLNLPAYALYALPRGASWWMHFSRNESEIRKSYEAAAWGELGVRDIFHTSNPLKLLGVVGLAVGEGLGEIELLRCILNDLGPEGKVHYLAVDMSPVLLLAHFDTLRDALSEYIRNDRLVVAAVLGDMYRADRALAKARRIFAQRGAEFCPFDIPLLCTCFGNVIGNQIQPDQEIDLFNRLKEMFTNRPLCILGGISVSWWTNDKNTDNAQESEQYDPMWSDFLVTTPRHLAFNLGVLSSGGPAISDAREFAVPTTSQTTSEQKQPATLAPEQDSRGQFWNRFVRETYGSFDIRCEIHHFYYRLKYSLSMRRVDSDNSQDSVKAGSEDGRIAEGRDLLLARITRYEPKSLARAIKNQGFEVKWQLTTEERERSKNEKRVPREDYKMIPVGDGELRWYTVIAAWMHE